MRVALSAIAVLLIIANAHAEPTGGIALFGDLKYKPDFTHFDYVNPDAPKGGAVKFSSDRHLRHAQPLHFEGRNRGKGSVTCSTR